MAEENDAVIAEVMNLLEAKPAAALPAAGPDIPALAEAQIIIANNQLKPADPAPDPPTVADTPSADPPRSTKNILTTTQWLSVISIIVSLVAIYYKREEIKSVFIKRDAPPSPVVPRAPPPLPVDAAPPPRGIRKMD